MINLENINMIVDIKIWMILFSMQLLVLKCNLQMQCFGIEQLPFVMSNSALKDSDINVLAYDQSKAILYFGGINEGKIILGAYNDRISYQGLAWIKNIQYLSDSRPMNLPMKRVESIKFFDDRVYAAIRSDTNDGNSGYYYLVSMRQNGDYINGIWIQSFIPQRQYIDMMEINFEGNILVAIYIGKFQAQIIQIDRNLTNFINKLDFPGQSRVSVMARVNLDVKKIFIGGFYKIISTGAQFQGIFTQLFFNDLTKTNPIYSYQLSTENYQNLDFSMVVFQNGFCIVCIIDQVQPGYGFFGKGNISKRIYMNQFDSNSRRRECAGILIKQDKSTQIFYTQFTDGFTTDVFQITVPMALLQSQTDEFNVTFQEKKLSIQPSSTLKINHLIYASFEASEYYFISGQVQSNSNKFGFVSEPSRHQSQISQDIETTVEYELLPDFKTYKELISNVQTFTDSTDNSYKIKFQNMNLTENIHQWPGQIDQKFFTYQDILQKVDVQYQNKYFSRRKSQKFLYCFLSEWVWYCDLLIINYQLTDCSETLIIRPIAIVEDENLSLLNALQQTPQLGKNTKKYEIKFQSNKEELIGNHLIKIQLQLNDGQYNWTLHEIIFNLVIADQLKIPEITIIKDPSIDNINYIIGSGIQEYSFQNVQFEPSFFFRIQNQFEFGSRYSKFDGLNFDIVNEGQISINNDYHWQAKEYKCILVVEVYFFYLRQYHVEIPFKITLTSDSKYSYLNNTAPYFVGKLNDIELQSDTNFPMQKMMRWMITLLVLNRFIETHYQNQMEID
ncbi:UNKNOWN [Stylonychia lemnae]|uniref:Uncharacterized protein n=1 Tax=Stylonychia lemnae TaxID=5949 RepID=A0A078B741_STYLE|nr:UNKNOWN [Stylonychia lemnae]|eukprot:CDW89122.1 UNKNOWN [Stylonychia lemnae]